MHTRMTALDGLRGIGALIVVLWHVAVVFFPAAAWGTPGPGQWVHGSPLWVMLKGTFAVCLFFVLSGYVLTVGHFRAPSRTSLIKRMIGRPIRLGLPAAASTLGMWALYVLHPTVVADVTVPVLTATGGMDQVSPLTMTYDTSAWGLTANLFWLPWFQSPDFTRLYSGVLWTMYVELSGSLIAMTLALILTRVPRKIAALAALTAALALFLAIRGYGIYFAMLLVGTAIAAVDPEKREWHGQAVTIPLTMFALGLVAGAGMFTALETLTTSSFASGRTVVMAGGALLVFVAVVTSQELTDILSLPVFRFLGRISFPLYLFHALVMAGGSWIFLALGPDVPVLPKSWIAAIFSVAASVVVAWAATRWIDDASTTLARRAGEVVTAHGLTPVAQR